MRIRYNRDFSDVQKLLSFENACACLAFAVNITSFPPSYENEPTGFHLIIALNKEVSCSSVQGSDTCLSFAASGSADIANLSIVCSTGSTGGVGAAPDGTRPFLLGGIVQEDVTA